MSFLISHGVLDRALVTGAIRLGLRLLEIPIVGCGTHAVQLCVKHCVPPLKKRQKKPAAVQMASDDSSGSDADTGSDSDSSSSSTSSLSADGAPAAAQSQPPRRRGRQEDPEQVAIRKELESSFERPGGFTSVNLTVSHQMLHFFSLSLFSFPSLSPLKVFPSGSSAGSAKLPNISCTVKTSTLGWKRMAKLQACPWCRTRPRLRRVGLHLSTSLSRFAATMRLMGLAGLIFVFDRI